MSSGHAKFLEWLEKKGWSQSEAARQIGCHQTMINKLCVGSRIPGRALAARIQELSRGRVRASDWDQTSATGTEG